MLRVSTADTKITDPKLLKATTKKRMSLKPRDPNLININNNKPLGEAKLNARPAKRAAQPKINAKNGNEDEPKAKRLVLGKMEQKPVPFLAKIEVTTIAEAPPPNIILDFDPAPDVDVDHDALREPYAFAEFVSDIMIYYKSRELAFQPVNYISNNFSARGRSITIDWLVELQECFQLCHETLYLAVNIMDRYFSIKGVPDRRTLQMVSCSCVLLASKFEERNPPFIDDLVYMSKDAFNARDLINMEQTMLTTIGFDLGTPSSYSFLRRFGRAIKADMKLLTTARYALELSLYFLDFCRVSPSRLAAAALLWALRVTKKGDWDNVLWKYSGYALVEIEQLMYHLNHLVIKFRHTYPELKAVLTKYHNEAFFFVAKQEPLPNRLAQSEPIAAPVYLTQPQSFPAFNFHKNI